MRFIKEQQYQMLSLIARLLTKNKAVLSENVPALEELIEDFTETFASIKELRFVAKPTFSLAGLKKRNSKNALADAVMKLQAAVSVYARTKQNVQLLESVNFKRSFLMRAKSEAVAGCCKTVIDAANSIGAIRQFGVTFIAVL